MPDPTLKWCGLAGHICTWSLAARTWGSMGKGRWLHVQGHWMALGTRCLFIWQKESCSSLMGLCLAGTALQASGLEQSLRLMSLYSLLGLYFQDFSGKIKPLKNTPRGPAWDDCMMNVSHKVRLMLLWHLWENLVLVFTPTLLLVQCLMPKLNTWFSWLLSEFSVDCSLLQRVPVVCLLFVWHLSEGGTHHMCAVSRL